MENILLIKVIAGFILFGITGARVYREMILKKLTFSQFLMTKKWPLLFGALIIIGNFIYIRYKVNQHENLVKKEEIAIK